ncbi:hypothetical protein GGI12_000442 [Dipsacomyces acuminosporus]|nr:hypothetical protein GGI12_000442 [Dipsacomyces acuminosporus]
MKLATISCILASAVGVCSLGAPNPGHDHIPWPLSKIKGVAKRAAAPGDLRILTQNMFMRPPPIQNGSNGDYKDARLDYFIEHILPTYSVVCLQEMFGLASSRRDRLVEAAKKLGFTHSVVSELPDITTLAADGGLVILSKYPIVNSEHHDYPRGKGADWFAIKGILYARLAISNPNSGQSATFLHLFNTHTQASYSNVTMTQPEVKVRMSQIHEFHSFLESILPKYRRPGEAVVLAGDFNVDSRAHKLSDPGHYRYEREAEDGKVLSAEGAAMMDVLQGKGIDPKILGPGNKDTYKGKSTIEIHDVLQEKFGYRPVTFGNIYVDANGTVRPKDTVLTGKEDGMSMQSIDYILWHNPDSAKQKSGAIASIGDVSVAPNFTPGQPFTQISDHYGVSAQVHFEFG